MRYLRFRGWLDEVIALSGGMSRIVFEATGGTLEGMTRFAQQRLFEPVGMRSALIEPDESGVLVGSSYGYATARDWARYGLLHLNHGQAGGKRRTGLHEAHGVPAHVGNLDAGDGGKAHHFAREHAEAGVLLPGGALRAVVPRPTLFQALTRSGQVLRPLLPAGLKNKLPASVTAPGLRPAPRARGAGAGRRLQARPAAPGAPVRRHRPRGPRPAGFWLVS